MITSDCKISCPVLSNDPSNNYIDLSLIILILSIYLQNLKQQQENHKKEFGPYYDLSYDGFVCVDQFGKLHTPNYVSHSFKKVIRKNDLPDIRFHDLRHSCATMLLSLGFSMKAVQEQLGHTQYTTTANTYAHV